MKQKLVHRHFIMNKPYGYVSQFVFPHKRKKGLLGDLYDFPEGTMAIGRLDVKSEGLLLLTTDGKISYKIRSNKVEKEYHVQVDGIVTQNALDQLQKGVEITVEKQKYHTKAHKAQILQPAPQYPERPVKVRDARHGPTSWLSITVTEGKFRQIRKMTAAVGFPTLRLIRVCIGKIILDHLKPGEVVELDTMDY